MRAAVGKLATGDGGMRVAQSVLFFYLSHAVCSNKMFFYLVERIIIISSDGMKRWTRFWLFLRMNKTTILFKRNRKRTWNLILYMGWERHRIIRHEPNNNKIMPRNAHNGMETENVFYDFISHQWKRRRTKGRDNAEADQKYCFAYFHSPATRIVIITVRKHTCP